MPGTDDADGADNLERTINVTGADPADVTTVHYPTGFGVGVPGVAVIPLVLSAWGETYNSSTDKGVAATLDAVVAAPGDTIVVVSHSQGSRAAGNAAEIIQRDDLVPGKTVLFVLLADPGFPVTGAENQMPSFIPGIYTAGERTPGDANSNVKILSICVKTDPTCGFNAYEFSSWFYLLPGFYGHGQFYQNLDNNAVSRTWTVGNTTYMVLEPDNGENPWGYLLRAIGLPVPKEFDKALTALVPYTEPGQRTSVGGQDVPTPREIQVALSDLFGLPVPGRTAAPQDTGYTVTVPAAVATGSESTPPLEEDRPVITDGDSPSVSNGPPSEEPPVEISPEIPSVDTEVTVPDNPDPDSTDSPADDDQVAPSSDTAGEAPSEPSTEVAPSAPAPEE